MPSYVKKYDTKFRLGFKWHNQYLFGYISDDSIRNIDKFTKKASLKYRKKLYSINVTQKEKS